MSEPSREAIARILRQRYEKVSISLIDTLPDLERLVARDPDLVFLGLKYIPFISDTDSSNTDKIWVSQYLADHALAHTGSSHRAHQLDVDKALAKTKLKRAGLATADFVRVATNQEITERDIQLSYPLFVKPTDRGGGLGIDENSVVSSFTELRQKVSSIHHDHGSDVLIERYLPGREFSVAILRNVQARSYQVVPVELIAEADKKGQRILGEAAKSANKEKVIELQSGQLRRRVSHLAIQAFKQLGGRDYGRIDIRLDEHGNPHFLEANLLPSLIAGYGTFPKACKFGLGMEHQEVIEAIIELAAERTSADDGVTLQAANFGVANYMRT